MDKKKVKELIEKTIRFTKATDDDYIQGNVKSHIINTLQVALKEISKSDWVSVEDGLPPKNVVVRVCNKQNSDDLVLAYRTSKETMKIVYPNNVAMYTITHWCKIEKLED